MACCSTARVVAQEHVESAIDPEHPVIDSRPTVIGNKTEAALLILTQSEWGDCDDADARRAAARFGKPGGSRLFPFSSARKRMSVLVVKDNDLSDQHACPSPQRVTRSNVKTCINNRGLSITRVPPKRYWKIVPPFWIPMDPNKTMTASKRKQFEKLITGICFRGTSLCCLGASQ